MKKHAHPVVVISLIIMMVAISCRQSGRRDPVLGETFRSEEGGYIINKVVDYEFEESFGMVVMLAPDGHPETGPMIMAHGAVTGINKSAQDLLDEIQGQSPEIQFEPAKRHVVDGMEGLLADLSGEYGGERIKGRLFVVPPYPQQEFFMTAFAPEGRWPTLAVIFDRVLKSVEFIEAVEADFGFDDPDIVVEEVLTPLEVVEEVEEISPYLGERYYHEEDGYSFRKFKDYDFSDEHGVALMTVPGLESMAGPIFSVASAPIDLGMTIDDLVQMLKEFPEEVDTNFSGPFDHTLAGLEGAIIDFDGYKDGQAIRGQLFLAMLKPDRLFMVRVDAPTEDWTEMFLRFNDLLRSFRFNGGQPATSESRQVLRQWAVYAEASSEYTKTRYSAMQATGAPDVEGCSDDERAWATAYSNMKAHLRLEYEIPVNPTELVIYQNLHPSQVVEILFEDLNGNVWVLWEGLPKQVDCPNVWTHTIELYEVFFTNTVVIIIDQSLNDWGWAEIDAVELVGYPQGN